MNASRKVEIFAALCFIALAPMALAGQAHLTTLNYPGAAATFASGINPAGDIVGAYSDSSGKQHGFVLRDGTFTSFDYPGATWTNAYGITPRGRIVGQYGLADNTTHGFLLRIAWRENEESESEENNAQGVPELHFYPVEVAGPTDAGLANTMPFAINAKGQIAGCYHQGAANGSIIAGTMHGFVLAGGDAAFDPLPGTMHTGINSAGDITGYSADGRSYVVSGSDGSRSWFTVPGALATRALGISASGAVVGWYKDGAGKFHGFLLRHGNTVTIDVGLPGVTQTRATGINAAGDIIGYYVDATGIHGFLLSREDD